ncbi:hypothetical protein SAMD00020551_1981 [Mesobacillus selenatarsenatis SF-1]|uniref:Uncharacterized protein n=1 Tax=Mesobacillus selenatarsenatis (strain DSM 18680 / JCM 14380 / FERM P-15431 / SF-1) TaxID=1321606 RepID=A0A0A8X3L6_MESS1|nr:hypothetical protein SAMD00020551_1981 [Mesobacillus selenatarsenatis SF-1]
MKCPNLILLGTKLNEEAVEMSELDPTSDKITRKNRGSV